MSEDYSIGAGSLNVSGTFTGTLGIEGFDILADLLGLSGPSRHHVRVGCPPNADKRCPVCREPAEAVVLEDVALFNGGQAKKIGDGTGYWLMGLDPAAYGCEPCGHRFDRDGQEIKQ